MQTVKEFPYLLLIWDEESRALITQWRGGFVGRNLKEGLQSALDELLKYRPYAQYIGDTTDIGVIGNEEQAWIDEVWYPKFLASGIQYMAVVQPNSAVAKLSVDSSVSRIPGSQLTVFNCASLDEAREWIKEQDF